MSSRQSSYEMHERYVLANKGGEIMINELKRKLKEVYGENKKAENYFKFNFELTEKEKEELKEFSGDRKIGFIIGENQVFILIIVDNHIKKKFS